MKRMKPGRMVVGSVVVASLVAPVCRAESPHVARLLGNAVADAVDKAMPAVVVVRTESVVYHAARAFPFGPAYGIPERPWLGIRLRDVVPAPGEKDDARAVQRAVFKRNLGDSVRLRVIREGLELEFDIVTEAMPDLGRLEKRSLVSENPAKRAFVASFVASQIDIARDKVFRALTNVSGAET